MAEQKNSLVQAIIGLIATIGVLWYFFGGGLHQGVANNFEKQYEMALRGGSAIDVCVHAGLVSAAYLQAHDQSNYQRWKQKESEDCARAGVPR